MAIYFQCACGQDLRAEERQAGGSIECVACGRPALVPSLTQANQGLGLAAQPLLESLEIPGRPPPPPRSEEPTVPVLRVKPEEDTAWEEVRRAEDRRRARRLVADARRELRERRSTAPGWQRETTWLECLVYPLRTWPVLLGLALGWATVTALLLAQMTDLFRGEDADAATWLPGLPFLAVLFALWCFHWGFYQCVLASATEGEAGVIRWPGADVLLMLRSGTTALVGFLAGPAVFVAVAVWFWMNSGELEWLDQLILVELGLAAATYWALVLLAVEKSGRLRDVNPLAVLRLAGALEWRGWVLILLAALGGVVHFQLAFAALGLFHDGPGGWFVLGWWGFWGFAWVVFLLRWYGLARYRERRPAARGADTPAGRSERQPQAVAGGSGPTVLPTARPALPEDGFLGPIRFS